MPAHNPYIAWMYEKFSPVDPASKTIIECFDQLATALNHQAYLLSLVIKDNLGKHCIEPTASVGEPTRSLAKETAESLLKKVFSYLIWFTNPPLLLAVKDREKALFLTEALYYHAFGSVVGQIETQQLLDSPSLSSLRQSLVSSICPTSDDSAEVIAHALALQVETVASDIVRQILYGEVPPLRRTEDFLKTSDRPNGDIQSAVESISSHVGEHQKESKEIPFSGVCQYCGLAVASGGNICDNCRAAKPISESGASPLVYAGMGERFCAYLADYILIYLLVFVAYLVSGMSGSWLPSDDGSATVMAFLMIFVYMTIAQLSCHTTVGKYMMGIEVINESPRRKYPSWGKIILRETVGRIVSCFFWGAGYWLAIRNPTKQAWSDGMAGTLVVARRTNPVLVKAMWAFVTIALLVDIGGTAYGNQEVERQKRYEAFSKQLELISADITTNQKETSRLLALDAPNLDGYKQNMRELAPWLDRYEAVIGRMEATIRAALRDDTVKSPSERQQMEKILQLWELRKRQSQLRRDQAQVILDYTPDPQTENQFKTQLELVDSDINGLEHKAAELSADIQKK